MLDGLLTKAAGALFVGVPVGQAVMTGGDGLVTLHRLPKAVKEFYRMVWAMETIGPNLKTAISAAAPAVIVVIPPAVTVGSALFGAGYGFYRGFMNLGEVVGACQGRVKDFDKVAAKEVIESLEKLRPKLYPGEKPFDIRVTEAVKGLLGAHLAAPVESVGATAIVLKHWPRLYWNIRDGLKEKRHRWADSDSPLRFVAKLLSAAAVDGFTVLAVAVVPVTPVAGYYAGFVDSFVAGYKDGLRAVAKKVRQRLKQLDDFLTETEDQALPRTDRPQAPGDDPDGPGLAEDDIAWPEQDGIDWSEEDESSRPEQDKDAAVPQSDQVE